MVPAYQAQLTGMQFLLQDINELGTRIDEHYYKNLFLLVSQLDREATAYEIAARQEEKLLALGPVYMRLNDELLDTTVSRTLSIMVNRSKPYWEGLLNGDPLLPPPPSSLSDLTQRRSFSLESIYPRIGSWPHGRFRGLDFSRAGCIKPGRGVAAAAGG